MLERPLGESGVASAEAVAEAAGRDASGRQVALPKLLNKHQQRIYIRLLMICGDYLAIALAFTAASWLRSSSGFYDLTVDHLGVIIPVYLVTSMNFRTYSIRCFESPRHGISSALLSLLVTVSISGLIVFFLKTGANFSRAVIGTGALFSLATIPVARLLAVRLARRMFGRSTLNEVLVIDGVSVEPAFHGIVIDAEVHDLHPRLNDPAMLDRLGGIILNADRVVVACPPERRWIWAQVLKGADVKAEVFAPELQALGPIGIGRYDHLHTLVVAAGPLAFNDRVQKRVFDIVVALIILPIIAPIMILTAIAIRLDSPGPIFFVQKRVGLANRLFPMYKFRSMRVEKSDSGGDRSTGRKDDRITRVGDIIRKTSIDELPQLFNVLLGQMSIVGPRPHALGSRAEEKLFWDIEETYWHRHAVKPGLTGLAQVRGYRGATEKVADLSNRLQADLEYLNGWSIWRDLSIIFATFRVLVHRNAF